MKQKGKGRDYRVGNNKVALRFRFREFRFNCAEGAQEEERESGSYLDGESEVVQCKKVHSHTRTHAHGVLPYLAVIECLVTVQ